MKKLTRVFAFILAFVFICSTAFAAEIDESIAPASASTIAYMRGDVDGDGTIGVDDATQIRRNLNGMSSVLSDMTDEKLKAADVNQNERVDLGDPVAIQRNLNGMSSALDLPYTVSSFSAELDGVEGLRDYLEADGAYSGEIKKAYRIEYDYDAMDGYDGKVLLRGDLSEVKGVVGWNSDAKRFYGLEFGHMDGGLYFMNSRDASLFTEVYCLTETVEPTAPVALTYWRKQWTDTYQPRVETGASLYLYGETGEVTDTLVTRYYFPRLEYNDGTMKDLAPWEIELTPSQAPEEAGPFNVEIKYTLPNGTAFTTDVEMQAYAAEPVISEARFNDFTCKNHYLNGKTVDVIIFSDAGIPNADIAQQIEFGDKVYGYRLTGSEEVLYVTTDTPGVKPIIEDGTVLKVDAKEIDARALDTSRLTSLSFLKDTASNVTKPDDLRVLNLSGCDFSSVTDADHAFADCYALRTVDMSGCDLSNVETMAYMFYNTRKLESVSFSNAITTPGKLTSTAGMFDTEQHNAENSLTIDLSGINMDGVTDAGYMFKGRTVMESLDLSDKNFGVLTNAAGMFMNCKTLSTLALPASGMPALTSVNEMFCSCSELSNADLSGICFDNVTEFYCTFINAKKLNTTLNIDLSNLTGRFDGFNDFATDDSANVVINCPQATKDMFTAKIPAFNLTHITFNVTD